MINNIQMGLVRFCRHHHRISMHISLNVLDCVVTTVLQCIQFVHLLMLYLERTDAYVIQQQKHSP